MPCSNRTSSCDFPRRKNVESRKVIRIKVRGFGTVSNSPSPLDTAISGGACLWWCLQAHRQSPRPRHLRKRTRSQGPFLSQHYPASTVIRPCPTPAMAAAFRDVEAATLALDGSPPITRTTFPTCRAHYPGGSSGCACRLLPRSYSLSPNGRRVGIRIVTFEACSGFTHVTARRIAQPPKSGLCHEAPAQPVTRPNRSSATRSIDNSLGGFLLHW